MVGYDFIFWIELFGEGGWKPGQDKSLWGAAIDSILLKMGGMDIGGKEKDLSFFIFFFSWTGETDIVGV